MTAAPTQGSDYVPLGQLMSARQRWALLLSLMLALFVSALDQTVVSTATPKILADLGGFNLISWLFTSYMLTSTVAMPIAGKLGDMYGRKPFLLAGVIAFMGASAACGGAPSMESLVILRAIQGIGAGIIMSTVFATIGDIFTPLERGRYIGLFTGTFSLASLIGPVLGGFLTDHGLLGIEGWRFIFYVNIPVGLVALPAIVRNLPPAGQRRRAKLDIDGAILLSGAAVVLLLAMEWAGDEYAWGSSQIVGLLAVAALLTVLFVAQEARHPEPIIPLSLFRNRTFVTANLILFAFGLGVFGCFQYLGLFIQAGLGKSATASGIITMPQSIGVVVSSVIGGQLIARTARYRYQTVLGTLLIVGAMALLRTVSVDMNAWWLRGYLLLLGLGFGMVLPTMSLVVQNAVPFHYLGAASSSSQFFRQIGAVMGAALFALILARSYEADLADRLTPADAAALGPAVVSLLEDPTVRLNPQVAVAIQGQFASQPGGADLVADAFRVQAESLTVATRVIFTAALGSSLVTLVVAVFLKEIPMRRPGTPPVPAREPGRPDLPGSSVPPAEPQRADAPDAVAPGALAPLPGTGGEG